MYVQFEIESNSCRMSTLKKLAIGLVDHLVLLKNTDIQVNKIIGFYVSKGGFEMLNCEWSEASGHLRYFCKPTVIDNPPNVFQLLF